MTKPFTINHIEIPAPDLAKGIQFYSTLFNWEFEVLSENEYAFFKIGDTGTGGGLDATLQPANEKQGVQFVISVDDIPTKLKKIEESGGAITKEKTEIPGGLGFYACFVDPNGNHVQMHCME
ncbi:VOC family protein [Halalkalibacterium halodurans]|uniref:VOC family protein n=1 Tax=Halalkalibacterium halodurans TaxID=86665 RepID=UPI002AA9B49B|nr:VOC family protein [Halalkalibacterium halodurans]MDY7220812.1 VOC family protein [Halalkalibacterium halodurans]MDY7240051.1 VOC family protein [Halalkalibacterium halodurans]